jgi:hypothetical protein
MEKSHRFHQQYPTREFVHTSREELDIRERQWLGINGVHCYFPAHTKTHQYSELRN